MKKTIIIMIGFLAIMCFTSSVYAAALTQTTGGTTVTVTPGTVADYPVLTFQPSPGIILEGVTSTIAYTIVSASNKSGASGIAYCLISADGIIYQDPINLAAAATGTGLTMSAAGVKIASFSSK